jgi:hypothetical protein
VTMGDSHHHAVQRQDAPAENHAGRAHPEYVALDIGEEFGALIVHTGAELHGSEVEISPAGQDEIREHKEVLERSINGRPAFSLVFDKLVEGRYTLWIEGVARNRGVTVAAGEIGELDWTAHAGE